MDNSIQVTFRGVSIAESRTSAEEQEFVIHPRSKKYRIWESLSVFLCSLTCLLVPYQACFDSKSTGLWVATYIFDALFLVDVVFRFFLAFYYKASLITDRTLIKSGYLKGRFAMDLLSILPLDVFVFARSSHLVWYQTLSYLRLNRMIRFHRIMKFFDIREKELGSSTALLRAIKYFIMGIILVHLFSCIWFTLGCDNVGLPDATCAAEGWAMKLNTGLDKIPLWNKYVMSFYWATATATSTGYGDIHAVNNTEKWFSIVAMLVGIALFFGLILGGMASMLTNSDSRRARYTHHLNVIKDYMEDIGVSYAIKDKVMAYYEYLWSTSKGVNGLGIFNDLPITFQAELSLSINRKVLDKAPLFMDLSSGFKRMLSLVIKPMFFMPNQVIADKGEIGHHMYYIHKGKAEILDERCDNVLITLTEGKLFGEVSLVYNLPRSTTVRAATPCIIFTLDRADMNRVIKHYPEVADKLYATLEHRCDLMTQTSNDVEITEYEDKTWISDEPGQKKSSIVTFLRHVLNHVIMPDSTLVVIWERIHLVAVLLVCFFYPYVSSFSVSLHALGFGENVPMTIVFGFTYVLDFILLADFLMRFNLATATATELKEIRHNYTRTLLFWIDLISVLPIEIFAFTQSTAHDRWHFAAFLKLNRLLKVFRMSAFFSELEDRLEHNIGKVRSLKFAIYITLATHLCACLWFFEACYGERCDGESWAQHVAKIEVGFDEYIASMYWAAATMSSTGYGDIHAHDLSSQIIAVFVMFVGLLLYGYCLSSIAATLANSASPKVEFLERINAVQTFMVQNKLSSELISQVNRYLVNLWGIHRGEVIPRAKRLMDDMPISLQQDVCAEESKEIMEKVPIFMETEESFLRKLSLKTTSYLFNPGDYIVYAGDMGREMYCVRRGLVEIVSDDGINIATLGPGSFFGEVGLIFGESRLASVQAKTYCQILMLTKVDLDDILQYFPVVARQLNEAGASDTHLKAIQKAALDSTRAAIHRISISVQAKSSSREGRLRSMINKSSQIGPVDQKELEILKDVDINEEHERPYRELSPLTRIFSFFLMRKGIIPTRTWFRVWQAMTIFVAGVYMVTLALQASVLHVDIPLWVLNYIFDVIFWVDIYIKFHVGFYNENNILVTHPLITAKNYFRTNFLLDLFCCLPTGIIVFAIWPEQYGVLRILAFARLNRCLHFYKLVQFFGFMEEQLGQSENFYRELKFAVYMGLFTHYVACGWFVMACVGQKDGTHICNQKTWVQDLEHGLGQDDSAFHRYAVSLYWAAATTASVGYGDLHAYFTDEMTYSLFCMIIGIVFYGFIIASVAASLANADAQRARYQERLSAIKNFLEDQNIAENLRQRIISHYEYIWIRNRGVDPSSLFQGIPLALQADITLSVYKDIIEKVPLFQGTEIGFLKMLSMHIKPVYFLAKEYVVKKGDIGQEMYFIHAGQVEVVSEHETPIVFDTMGAGRFFGEISIVFSCPRTASIRTKTNCDVFVLTKADLDEVLIHYPLIKKKILETAEERQRMVRERAAAFAAKKKEEEDRKRQEEEDRKKQEEENKDKESDKEDDGKDSKETKKEEPTDDAVEVVDVTEEGETTNCIKTCCFGLVNLLTGLVILPESKLRIITFVNCLLIFATSLSITYMAAFQDHSWFLIAFNYVCEASFYLEIFFNFHLAFVDKVGDVITDHKSLVLNYFKGKFPYDLLASFPIDIFALAAPYGRRLEILSYLRLLHLLRFLRMEQFFSEYGKKLDIDVFKVRMSKFLFDVILMVHVFACCWFFIDCPGAVCSREHTWIYNQGLEHSDSITRYCTSLYWVVATVTSTGYGDVHSDDDVEMVFSSCVMVIGKLLFGFILGNIASTLANAEIRRVKYEEKIGAIEEHMEDQEIPPSLQNRVRNFYEFIWNKNKGVEFESLFHDMPQCMYGELANALTGDIITKIPIFADADIPFIRLLATKARPCQFHAKEYIVRRGDIGQEMFLIKKGLVEIVTDEHPPEIIETLEEGSFFGEKSLVISTPRGESVRASTHVEIFVLKKEGLEEVLQHYEDVKIQISEKVFELYGVHLD